MKEPSPRYLVAQTGRGLPDWENVKLGAVASFRTGPFGSALHKSDYVFGGVPVVNPMQIEDGRIKPTERMSVAEEAAERLGEFRLKVGDVVIGRRGEMGRCAFVLDEQEGWLCGTGSMIVRPGVMLDGRFLQRMLSSNQAVRAIESASVGTTMINLNQRTLADLSLHIPINVDEQVAIADALADADALIDSLELLLTKKRQVKQGAMQELLTGKRRLPGFKQPWISRAFVDVASVSRERVNPSALNTPPLCIELEQLEPSTGRLSGDAFESQQAAMKSVFRRGDVLFGKLRAYLRKYWLAEFDGVCSTEIWVLRSRGELVSNVYLFYTIQRDNFIEAASTAYGTHMPRSDWKIVAEFDLTLPRDATEQAAIAQVLFDMDAEITALESRLTKARAIKQAMAQALLTGRIRLMEST